MELTRLGVVKLDFEQLRRAQTTSKREAILLESPVRGRLAVAQRLDRAHAAALHPVSLKNRQAEYQLSQPEGFSRAFTELLIGVCIEE